MPMIHAYLSDFPHLTPSQRANVTHWIIDDPDRPDLKTYDLSPSTADVVFDIEQERIEQAINRG